MSVSYDIESYIATHHPSKYDQFKKLKYNINNLNIVNPLRKKDNPETQLVRMLIDPEYCHFTCKHILGQNLMSYQSFLLKQLYAHSRPMLICTRGFGKTFCLGLYAMYRAFIRQGSKIVIVGSGFRQSKMMFEVCEKVWHQADVLRDIVGRYGLRGEENGPHYSPDKLSMVIGESEIIAIPIGIGGQKIRGFRSNCTIADEFDSHELEIFEKVIKGFGAVSENPVEKVNISAHLEAARKLGISQEEMGINIQDSFNQEIIAGTCSYADANLGNYYKKYKAIIESGGDKAKLRVALPEEYEKFEKVDPKHYCIFRVPYNLLPPGYMSDADIESARATSSSDIFNSEFGCVFMDDSSGFFKKSLIDSAIGQFHPILYGRDGAEYVIGVDPASEKDNFAIVVLEVYKNQKRVVSCYTTNRKKFNKDQADSRTSEKVFYSYAANKIYEVVKRLGIKNVLRIDIDKDGGGHSVRDELTKLATPIYEVVEFGNPKPTDNMEGLHIVNLIRFQDYEWVSDANHDLKRDMEQKNLLFPKYDPYHMLAEDMADDELKGFMKLKNINLLNNETIGDSTELMHDEIEMMKKELTSIIVTQTKTGKESWGLPTKRTDMPQNNEFKKDRYSALLMANAAANEIVKSRESYSMSDCEFYGELATKLKSTKKKKGAPEQMFYGSNPFMKQINATPCGMIRR
jgi:hypothetical protein